MQNCEYLFRIFSNEQWEIVKKKKGLRLKEIDTNFNFIHLCTEKQLLDTICVHFKNTEEIVILRLSLRGLEPNLKWEMSRNNDLFPHYYGDISFDNMIDFKKIKVNKKINELFANKIF